MAANNTQNKPTKEDVERKDEYGGKYKEPQEGMSEAQKYGTEQNPAKHDQLPASGLKSVGG
jgi:hypothetical protein